MLSDCNAIGREFESWWGKNNLNLQFQNRWAVTEIGNTYLLLVCLMLKYAFGYGF